MWRERARMGGWVARPCRLQVAGLQAARVPLQASGCRAGGGKSASCELQAARGQGWAYTEHRSKALCVTISMPTGLWFCGCSKNV